jgi:isoquinoline 1-oxidoreductase beta subunit
VVDCGTVINPQIVEAQIQGGIVYGLTAALYGKITIEKGRVVQTNFPDYDMVRLAQMPKIEVHVIESTAYPGGVGEPGTPPIAPAVANAIFAATGKRVRSLPLIDGGFTV